MRPTRNLDKKTFSLRIDVESDKGIKRGIPQVLDLLKKYNVKASFYLTMGGESNILDLIKYRKPMRGERRIRVYSFFEKLRMVLLPRDFVTNNRQILERILSEGHELGIHGWKHRAWTRGIDKIDVKYHLKMAKNRYLTMFGKNPVTFAAPGFVTNKEIINNLDSAGFTVISDLSGKIPFQVKKTRIINVPVTITGKNNSPIIESLVSEGFSDDEIVNKIKQEIQKRQLAVIYCHDLFECIYKIDLLERIFKFVKQNNIKVKTIKEITK